MRRDEHLLRIMLRAMNGDKRYFIRPDGFAFEDSRLWTYTTNDLLHHFRLLVESGTVQITPEGRNYLNAAEAGRVLVTEAHTQEEALALANHWADAIADGTHWHGCEAEWDHWPCAILALRRALLAEHARAERLSERNAELEGALRETDRLVWEHHSAGALDGWVSGTCPVCATRNGAQRFDLNAKLLLVPTALAERHPEPAPTQPSTLTHG